MNLLTYARTLLWARRLPRPKGDAKDRPYWRCCELAFRGLATGYGVSYPQSPSYSILEFGVATGHGLRKLLRFRDALLEHLPVTRNIHVVGFDTFSGMPEPRSGDEALPYITGDYPSDLAQVQKLVSGYENVRLVPGLFADTLPQYREFLQESPPLVVSVDCDWYSSTIDVFDHVLPLAPHGSMWYFDDVAADNWNPLTGELRAIHEVNEGRYGNHLRFVEHPLWIETRELRHWQQLYRLVNLDKAVEQNAARTDRAVEHA